jgi:hypothetical protein
MFDRIEIKTHEHSRYTKMVNQILDAAERSIRTEKSSCELSYGDAMTMQDDIPGLTQAQSSYVRRATVCHIDSIRNMLDIQKTGDIDTSLSTYSQLVRHDSRSNVYLLASMSKIYSAGGGLSRLLQTSLTDGAIRHIRGAALLEDLRYSTTDEINALDDDFTQIALHSVDEKIVSVTAALLNGKLIEGCGLDKSVHIIRDSITEKCLLLDVDDFINRLIERYHTMCKVNQMKHETGLNNTQMSWSSLEEFFKFADGGMKAIKIP